MSSLTKAEIVETLYRNLGAGWTRPQAQDLVESVLEMIRSSLERGETVKLPGFGNFSVRKKRARAGRNPKSGEEVEISARKVVSFKPSSMLKDRVSGQPSQRAAEIPGQCRVISEKASM
ncbi:MAG: integration host factor subunit alpha [Magnetococcales bacterium]|nr:integration host factor subunit alpha [Magnetococcales bacterium]